MPLATDIFAYVANLELSELIRRREELCAPYAEKSNYSDAPDEVLIELLAITRELRRRAPRKGDARTARPTRKKPEKPPIESLA